LLTQCLLLVLSATAAVLRLLLTASTQLVVQAGAQPIEGVEAVQQPVDAGQPDRPDVGCGPVGGVIALAEWTASMTVGE